MSRFLYYYAECRVLSITILSVVILNVVNVGVVMLSVVGPIFYHCAKVSFTRLKNFMASVPSLNRH